MPNRFPHARPAGIFHSTAQTWKTSALTAGVLSVNCPVNKAEGTSGQAPACTREGLLQAWDTPPRAPGSASLHSQQTGLRDRLPAVPALPVAPAQTSQGPNSYSCTLPEWLRQPRTHAPFPMGAAHMSPTLWAVRVACSGWRQKPHQ